MRGIGPLKETRLVGREIEATCYEILRDKQLAWISRQRKIRKIKYYLRKKQEERKNAENDIGTKSKSF